MTWWRWAISDASLPWRIAVGVGILAALAILELARKGREARRWREYAFLTVVVAIALVYGAVNDQITSRISWEYFYYGKELAQVLGDRVPPESAKLSWDAAKVGMKATWTVGLLIGVALLMANNPNRRSRQLSYRSLIGIALGVIVSAVAGALAFGWAGSRGWLAATSVDFREMVRRNEMRPYRFMTAYGVHLGGYIGGFIGAAWAIVKVRRRRRNSSAATSDQSKY
jgi:hypothetical protein